MSVELKREIRCLVFLQRFCLEEVTHGNIQMVCHMSMTDIIACGSNTGPEVHSKYVVGMKNKSQRCEKEPKKTKAPKHFNQIPKPVFCVSQSLRSTIGPTRPIVSPPIYSSPLGM